MEKRQEMENKQKKQPGFDEILWAMSQSKPDVSTSFDFFKFHEPIYILSFKVR